MKKIKEIKTRTYKRQPNRTLKIAKHEVVTHHLNNKVADFSHQDDNSTRGIVIFGVGPHQTHGMDERP